MKKYPKYKESGIAWLGEIPEHWEVRRLGSFGKFSKGGGVSRSELTENGIGVILYGDIYTKYIIKAEQIINRISEETANNSIQLNKGDLLFTGSGETKEDIGKCVVFLGNEETYAGGDVIIFKQNKFDSLFLSYVLNSSSAIFQKARTAKGDIIVHTYGSKLKNIYFPIPLSVSEQTTIANFLDYKLEKIDRFITKKKQLIELLNEQKAAIINELVTGKKIWDGNAWTEPAEVKPSGIKWLGDIPEHWVVKPLKYYVSYNDEALTNSTDKNYLLKYIDIGNVSSDGNINEIVEYKFQDAPSRARRIVKCGDVIISTVRTYLKAIAKIENDKDIIVSTGFAVLRPKSNIDSDFLNLVVRANYFIEDVCANSFGVSYPAINASKLVTLKLAVPTTIEKQKQIVNHIKTETAKIERTINTIEKEIALVEEYKTALIAEAVTGKIDVRDFEIPQEETPLAMVAEEAGNYKKES